jgi:hypothetical protein
MDGFISCVDFLRGIGGTAGFVRLQDSLNEIYGLRNVCDYSVASRCHPHIFVNSSIKSFYDDSNLSSVDNVHALNYPSSGNAR